MYEAKFENSKGQVFFFGYQYGNIFDIVGLTGQDLNVATSQGFNQVGETVENVSVGSKLIEIKGRLLGDATQDKRNMLAVFAPFESGRLIFENKYFIECSVKYTPIITVDKEDPKFELVLLAPYPYWKKLEAESHTLGGWKPMFTFPVNYGQPHLFGIEETGAFINAYNAGEIDAFYKLEFYAKGEVKNPEVINVKTQEFIKIYDTLYNGERILIYRQGGKLIVEKESAGIVQDAFNLLDENSDLLMMHVGDNILKATAEKNESLLVTTLTFNKVAVGVYEGI